jgi:hypothetical protein
VGEDAAAQEAPELALDEAGNGPIAGLCAGQERLQLLLHDAVEDGLLRAASRVGVRPAPAASAMRMVSGVGRGNFGLEIVAFCVTATVTGPA